MFVRARAPLRIGFAGGGTDLSPYCDEFGGLVMNATINMYAYAFLELRNDDRVIFEALDFGQSVNYRCGEPLKTDPGLVLHKGVYDRIMRDFNNGNPIPVRLTTYCDSPPGAGLGASSTLVVAMVQAFAELLRLPLNEYNLARLAYEIERLDVGLQGGKQDQYAATFGGFNFMEFFSDRVIVNPLRIKSTVVLELEASLVLYYTGKSRDSSDIIDQQSENVKGKKVSSIEAMHEVRQEAIAMKEALLIGDIKRFARVMQRGWEAKKRTATKVSSPEIDRIYELALATGAYAGKISGAGGGGFMIFLANPLERFKLIKMLGQESGKVYISQLTDEGAKAWKV